MIISKSAKTKILKSNKAFTMNNYIALIILFSGPKFLFIKYILSF